MRAIYLYEANDGSRWDSIDEATSRDALLDDCAAIEAHLGPRPTLPHGGSVEHDASRIQAFVNDLNRLARKRLPNLRWPTGGEPAHPAGIVGRVLDDSGMTPLKKLWYRYHCIRGNREYDQPYFAHYSPEALAASKEIEP